MRFSEKNYLKAFPRENKKPVKVEVVGNVIEEAEKLQTKKPSLAPDSEAPEAGNVIEGAENQEGADNAGSDND